MNFGRMTPLTTRHGKWLISTVVHGSDPGFYMSTLVGDTIYFNAGMMRMDTNFGRTTPLTTPHGKWVISTVGQTLVIQDSSMAILVGDTIYFNAWDGSSGHELWAHDTSNHSTWQVADINSGGGSEPGQRMDNLSW